MPTKQMFSQVCVIWDDKHHCNIDFSCTVKDLFMYDSIVQKLIKYEELTLEKYMKIIFLESI